MHFLDYLYYEILGIGHEPEKIEKLTLPNVSNLFKVPLELEKIHGIGFIICMDTFLYFFTYFPLRIIIAVFSFITFCQYKITSFFFSSIYTTKPIELNIVQIFDLLRLALLGSSFYLLYQLNLSTVYHRIRSQNTIKLYVLSSMIEVIDKLFASFGGDLFDSIQIQLTNNQQLPIIQTIIAFIYVTLHSLLYLSQVATLTVVINSADDSLLTILILNNFAELKGFVFKKYDKNNLFQLTCADILERFQSIIFVGLVFIVTMVQSGFNWWDYGRSFVITTLMILAAEAIADSFKHCFICKFNSISALNYRSYCYVVIQDLLACGKDAVVVDHTYAVSRRLGLCQVSYLPSLSSLIFFLFLFFNRFQWLQCF